VRLVGSRNLARMAEAYIRGDAPPDAAVLAEIEPCFVEDGGKRTDIVVLACTHYPFLTDIFAELAPWPVMWLDPASAIARRLVTVLEGKAVEHGPDSIALFTSGRPAPEPLVRLLAEHGLSAPAFA
jgi:glutamate racemase